MKTRIIFLLFFLTLLPMAINAQYYSGKVGETINLSDPTPPVGYEKYEAVYKTYSKHLDVYKGTSRVKILSYFTGYETVECVLYCVRQVPGKVPEYYTSKTYYYQISCSSAPEPDPEPDPEPNPDPNYDELYDPTKYYQTKMNGEGPCLGTINLKIGDTYNFNRDYTRYPKPENIKSIVWSDYADWGQDVTWGYQITYQSKSSCTIQAIEPCKERKLWYLMKYGSSTYKLYYLINVAGPEPTAITLSTKSVNVEVDKYKKLSYSLSPSGATSTVTWISYDPDIAFVSASGEIKGIKAGTTYVYAITANGQTDYCKVTVEEDVILVSSISLDPSAVTLNLNDTKQLTATISPSNATDQSVAWTSSNTSVATVSSGGLVTAKSAGSAIITCKANDGSGRSASCSITVESGKVEPTSISLPYSISVKVDESKTVTYTLTPSNATTSITWKSDDNTIATVSSSGVVTGVKAGTTKVRATTSNGKTDYCNVTVEGIDPISISLPSSKTVKVGDSFTMSYTLNPSNATTTLTWTSDDSSIATVSSSGVVTGKKVGSTYINVKTANGKSDYCKVTVEEDVVLVSSISLDPSAVTLNVNETKQLTATILPSNATDKNVTWTSSNTSVATVSSSGLVTANSVGAATITCKANDGSGKSAACSVTVSSYGITKVSFVSLTCDNKNLCKLKNSDVIKAHLTIKNIGETGLVQTRIRTYDDNDENTKHWYSTSELSQIVFLANETKTIDFDVSLKDAKKGSYYLALTYFDDKDQKWYYNTWSLKKIAIVDDEDLKGDGTRNNPYNCVAANAYAASLKPNETTSDDVYVKGIVSSVSYDVVEGPITLYISEDGNDNNRFYIYDFYYSWDSYSSGKLPQKGDEILIKGKLRYFEGNIPGAYYPYVVPISDALIWDTKQVTLSENGYATFFSSDHAYILPNGLYAQVVTGYNNNMLICKTIADGSASGIIPKATAVIIVSGNRSAGTYTLTPCESTVNYSGTNYLHGSDEATMTTASGSNYYFDLTYGDADMEKTGVVDWYWGAPDGGAFQIDGNKAWLALPKSLFDAPDVILDVLKNGSDDVYYDMQGRRIGTPTSSGIYIRNGKKVYIKSKK